MDFSILRIDYTFKNPDILRRALRHPSLSTNSFSFYQRCEFLGDRVLGVVIATYLFHRYPADQEGLLSKRLSNLVRRETLAEVGERINLGHAIQMAESEDLAGGRHNTSILGDGCEALIGAIYLDGGLEPARDFILKEWDFLFAEVDRMVELDPKTALQELLQKAGKKLPQYKVIEITGPDHAPFFTVEVRVKGVHSQKGEGNSKRQAEQSAAAKMLEQINGKSKNKEHA